jgi:hypothetical protein
LEVKVQPDGSDDCILTIVVVPDLHTRFVFGSPSCVTKGFSLPREPNINWSLGSAGPFLPRLASHPALSSN